MRKITKKFIALFMSLVLIVPVSAFNSFAVNKDSQLLNTDTREFTDPVSDDMFPENTISLKTAYDTLGTATIVGQVVYRYESNTVYLQDIIDGEIIGFQIYDYVYYDFYSPGEIVAVTGKIEERLGTAQMSEVTKVDVLGKAYRFAAQEVTIPELLSSGINKYLSEYVVLKGVILGAYNASGFTAVTDSEGNTINIYKPKAYPTGITEGSTVNLYCALTRYYDTPQLSVGSSFDYADPENDYHDDFGVEYEVDSSVNLALASWAGSGQYSSAVVYGDLKVSNDQLDESAKLTMSTGAIPQITSTSTSTGTKNYFLGSKGLKEGQYYQMEFSTEYFADLVLTFRMRGSATSAANWIIKYSTDNVNYRNGDTFKIDKDSTYQEFKIALPSGAADAEKLYLRVEVANSLSLKNDGSSTITSGTNRFEEIKITGSPIISDSIVRVPAVTPKSGKTAVGEEITITCETEEAEIYYKLNESEFKLYDDNNKPAFTELPASLTVYAKKEGLKDSVTITYNYTITQVGTVKISPNGGAVIAGKTVKLSSSTEGAVIKYIVIDTPDENNLTAKDMAESASASGYEWNIYNPEEKIILNALPVTIISYAVKNGCEDSPYVYANFTERSSENYSTYFGQIHSHTNYSDGAGSCEDAFVHSSKEVDNLNFLAVTDHSNSFDNEDKASISDGSMSSEWNEGHELAKQYTTDEFVCLFGYEMTWSNGLGHMNTFNTPGFQSRTQADYTSYSSALPNYYSALKTVTDSISQFNHPGTTFGDFSGFGYYDDEIDSLITLLEVGNGEGAIGSSGYFPSYEYYIRALDLGWHISPTNNQDNHKGNWGDANTARTVILADGGITEEKIYDALRNMRTYASEDNDLTISYMLDENIMGTILDKDDVSENVNIQVKLSDPTDESIGKVELIVNGGLSVYSETVNTNSAELNWTIPADYSYYFIKVTEDDGDIAVTAPVWIGEVESIGISLETNASLPVKGEALTLTANMHNNETEDFEISSIEFLADDKIIHRTNLTAQKLNVLKSCSNESYSFDYTGNAVGNIEITVILKGLYKGVEKVYKSILNLDYIDPRMVTNVIIDGTHFNDYVTGQYGANVNNVAEIAADKNVKVTVEKNEITKEMLDNCSLLIITAPAKSSGNDDAGYYSPKTFEQDFIDMVAEYAANGGYVAVCGTSDYRDKAGYNSSTEINKILSAIGSAIRLNSDEACDDVNKKGKAAYKLFLENFNMDSPYLDGVVQTERDEEGNIIKEGQQFSIHRGCTVDCGEKGEALVYGFDTTYSINTMTENGESDSDIVVQQGDVVALATESLNGGGRVFASGSVFISDYEVQAEMDNIWDLPYANRTIFENIISDVKVKLPVSSIAEMRTGEEGEVFRIIGTVTAGTANEYNKFFDTIYVEDETGGTTVFPYSEEGLNVGATVDITGYVDQYQGDKEIQIIEMEVIDNVNLKEVKPKVKTTAEAMDYDAFGGSYIQTEGKIVDVTVSNGVVSQFRINDGSGTATVFIDGYISSGTDGTGGKYLELMDFIKVGNTVSAAGMLYLHPEGESDVSVPCLRVNNTDDIKLISKIMYGDANQDNDINMVDVVTVQRMVAEFIDKNEEADVDKDGTVSMQDVVLIQKYIVGIISEF